MAVNLLIYPLDYPPTIVGPSDLELRVAELEAKMESVSILGLQDRRDGGNDAIDLELRDTTIGVFHSAIPRFGFKDRNLGTKGFMLGGETDGSLTGRIAKFDYLFETPSLIGADIGIARHSGAGTSAVATGYLSGGNTATNITAKIEKFGFDSESVSLLAEELQVPLSELAGFATTADSFTFGGLDGTSNSLIGQIRTLKHSTEVVTLLAAALAVPKTNTAVVGTTTSGFIVGGKTAIGSTNYSQSIEKMTWITQLLTPSSLALTGGVAFSVGVGNDFSGYIVGGRSGAANTLTIERIAHTTESISPIGISLSTPKADATAVGSSRIGYIMAGGTDPTGEFRSLQSVDSIQRLTFVGAENPVERLEPLSFSLPYGAVGASGISDYSPGTYSSNSVSIVNLYDGIYSKLGHVHDERYPLQSDVYYRPEVRRKLNEDLLLYVDILNTSPTATGLGTAVNPFGKIQAAVDWASGFDYNGYSLKIKVANGIYTESVVFDGTEWVGLKSRGKGAAIILEGNIANSNAVILATSPATTGTNIRVENGIDVWVKGFKFRSTYPSDRIGTFASALYAYNAGVIVYSDVTFGSGFDYQVLARLGSYSIVSGNIIIEASCLAHVSVNSASCWSIASSDQRYAMFPAATSVRGANMVFTANLTIFALFEVNDGSTLSFDTGTTFTGSSIVTGHSVSIGLGGRAYSDVQVDIDNPTKFGFVPSTLGHINGNYEVRTSGNQGIYGVKSFAVPPSIPNGVLANDAVNLAQLNSAAAGNVKVTGDQNVDGIKNFANNIRVPDGSYGLDAVNLNQLLYQANYRPGAIRIGPLQIVFGRTGLSGVWQAGGAVSFSINYNSAAPNMAAFTSIPTVVASVDRLLLLQITPINTNFGGYLDSPSGNVYQPDNCIMSWIAVGYV